MSSVLNISFKFVQYKFQFQVNNFLSVYDYIKLLVRYKYNIKYYVFCGLADWWMRSKAMNKLYFTSVYFVRSLYCYIRLTFKCTNNRDPKIFYDTKICMKIYIQSNRAVCLSFYNKLYNLYLLLLCTTALCKSHVCYLHYYKQNGRS